MNKATVRLDYPGAIKNIREVKNFTEFIEFILPYSLAKIYLTANRRWSFLEKPRRKKALAALMNRVIRRFSVNIWDVRSSNGGFLEDFHTMPVIHIISLLTTEYALQKGLVKKGCTFTLATFRLCGEGYISADLKNRIDRLHELKMRRDRNLTPLRKNSNIPHLYNESVDVLYELEQDLINAQKEYTASANAASA